MKILIFPKGENPYQELLYSEMRRLYPKSFFTYVSAKYILAPLYPLIFLVRRLQGYNVIHIHWLVFAIRFPIPYAKQIAYCYGVFCLSVLRVLGFKIVWTVHDVLPHYQHTSNDLEITQKYINQASAIIVLSQANIQDMDKVGLKYDPEKVSVIPIGNYKKQFPKSIDKIEARRILGIPDDVFVYIFLGQIKYYKNVPGLIKSFAKIRKTNPKVYLIIAGQVFDEELTGILTKAKSDLNENLIMDLQNVSDDAVTLYYSAADAATYPFKEVTNSSSTILAATFGLPIIAPLIGAIVDIPSSAGILYNPNQTDPLTDSMLAVMSNHSRLEEMAKASTTYADSLSWDKIAKNTMEVYKATIK